MIMKKKEKEEKTNFINNKHIKSYKSDNLNFNYEKENEDLSKLNMIIT